MTMANEGNRSVKGSDVFYDFACSLCDEKDKHVEAVKRCQDCKENLCDECLKNHNMFKAMRGHILVNKDDIGKVGQAGGCFVPTVKCENHFGKDIELYCGNHDVVGCATCIALEHRQCEDVTHIQQAVADVNDKEGSKRVAKYIKSLLEQTQRLKQARATDLKRINDKTKAVLHDVDNQIEAIVQRLGVLRTRAIEYVEENAQACTKAISLDVETLEDTIHKLEEDNKRLADNQEISESELFIYTKQSKTASVNLEKQLLSIDRNVGMEYLEFNVDKSVFKYVNELEAFVRKVRCLHVSSDGKVNIRVKDDTKTCKITDCCFLDNDKIVIADENNKCMKLFDQKYRLLDRCCTPGVAAAVCQDGDGGLAIALFHSKAVQFATADGHLCLTRCFTVGEKCRGIACANRKVYVSCGGLTKKNESLGQIRIYDINGGLMNTIQIDDNGKNLFTLPFHIQLLSNDGDIVVADKGNGLIAINEQNKVMWKVHDHGLQFVTGVCETKNGELLACSIRDGRVYQVNSKGQIRVIVNHAGPAKKLRSITYDSKHETFIITCMDSDEICVYHVNKND